MHAGRREENRTAHRLSWCLPPAALKRQHTARNNQDALQKSRQILRWKRIRKTGGQKETTDPDTITLRHFFY